MFGLQELWQSWRQYTDTKLWSFTCWSAKPLECVKKLTSDAYSLVPRNPGGRGKDNVCTPASTWTLFKVLALLIPPEKSKILFSPRLSKFRTWRPGSKTIQVLSCWPASEFCTKTLVFSSYSKEVWLNVSESLFQGKPSLNEFVLFCCFFNTIL